MEFQPLLQQTKSLFGTSAGLQKLAVACIFVVAAVVSMGAMLFGAWTIRDSANTITETCVTGESAYRLPTSVVPKSYQISIFPDFVQNVFYGTASIAIDVQQVTTCIKLHAEDLNVYSIEFVSSSFEKDEEPVVPSTFYNADSMVLTLRFPHNVPSGDATLFFKFSSVIGEDMRGFYRSNYTDTSSDMTRFLYSTQFESTSARRVFPCFDEPSFKALFTLRIGVDSSLVKGNFRVLANTPLASNSTMENGRQIFEFEQTPIPISTYIVAFVIGELDSIEATSSGTTYRVFTTPGKSRQGYFALDIAKLCTEWMGTYFDEPYPLDKVDLVAIPDFEPGAMENIGLITFRETALLADDSSDFRHNFSVAITTCHEVAHQWTGNLVTMKWWSDLWLNEGFATYLSMLALDHLFPSWNVDLDFVASSRRDALTMDAVSSSRPLVSTSVFTRGQIDAMFDTITYDKGASVLAMLHEDLGDAAFQSWLRNHIATHKTKSVSTSDLLKLVNSSFQSQFENWFTKPGFPLLTVTPTDTPNEYTLSQKRYISGNSNGSDDASTLWYIPVQVKSSAGTTQRLVIDKKTKSDSFTVSGSWFKINALQRGYYRVQYPANLWSNLIDAISSGDAALLTADRYGLVDDVFSSSFSNDTSITNALDLMLALKNEQSYDVWRTAISYLDHMGQLLSDKSINNQFRDFVRSLLQNISSTVGWDEQPSESSETKNLRNLILGAGGRFGDVSVISTSAHLFNQSQEGIDVIPTNLRRVVFENALRGDSSYYTALLEIYQTSTDDDERYAALYSLAYTEDSSLLQQTLALSISPLVRSQDSVYLILQVATNPFGRSLAWDFVKTNWATLIGRYGQGIAMSPLISVTRYFSDATRYKDVKSFFASHDAMAGKNDVSVNLDMIRSNELFLANHLDATSAWLSSHGF